MTPIALRKSASLFSWAMSLQKTTGMGWDGGGGSALQLMQVVSGAGGQSLTETGAGEGTSPHCE